MNTVDKTKPVHLIVNPHSGYGDKGATLRELTAALRRDSVDLVEYTTTAPRDATRYARLVAPTAGAVLVWGGDGTVNEVASGLAGSPVPMLPCPAGTENLLAKELRMPRNAAGLLSVFHAGQTARCDLGRINGKDFLMVIGVGFDGEVVRRLTAIRTGHITHLTYFWPIWRTFWEHQFPQMRIVIDGREVFDGRCMAFVGNIPRYASGLSICCNAHYDDGQFDLVIFPCTSPFGVIGHSARTFLRIHHKHPATQYHRFRHMTIETRTPVPCQVDGDPGPETPIEVSVTSTPIRLIVPPTHDGAPT